MNFKSSIYYQFLVVLLVSMSSMFMISCNDDTIDTTDFVLHYSEMTDIGPSMNAIVGAPTYHGGTPSEFSIVRVYCNDEQVTTESFTIDPQTGSVSIHDTESLPVGVYHLSISCLVGGAYHEFEKVLAINILRPVPEGITVEPNYLVIDLGDVKTSTASAQVKTDGKHVTISYYRIATSESYDANWFAVSKTGEVSLNKAYTGQFKPGVYEVSLVLKTPAGEGIFDKAVTFNITSKPLALTYNPNKQRIDNATDLKTEKPVLLGSLEEVEFKIASVTPATDKITIDSKTGQLLVSKGHNLPVGSSYQVSVSVKNKFSENNEFTQFDNAFVLEITNIIKPIANFGYTDVEKKEKSKFSILKNEGFEGDEVSFELCELPAELKGQLTIDSKTGEITSMKGNTIPKGSYTLTVFASNAKSITPAKASFVLTIIDNPNSFTFIKYGNNLGLTGDNVAYQYRFHSEAEMASATIAAPTTDIKSGIPVKWEAKSAMNAGGVSEAIDIATGAIDMSKVTWKATCGVFLVTATAGEGEDAVSLSVPVFIHMSAAVSGVEIEYTPFALQINPKKGGKSVVPVVKGVDDLSKFCLDYRRSFSYANFYGPESHVSGNLKNDETAKTTFMGQVWRNYYGENKPNYGARKPMSYYENQSNLSMALGYVNEQDKSVVINPGKWVGEDGVYANGVFIGQMTFVVDGNSANVGSGKQIFPLIVWFDEKF